MHIGLVFIFGFIFFGYVYTCIRKGIGRYYIRKAWAETEKVHQKGIEYTEKKYLK
jgi:hypothetical protein